MGAAEVASALPSKVARKEWSCKKAALLATRDCSDRQVRKTGKTSPALLAAARVHDVYE
jgi:hypothetical protein